MFHILETLNVDAKKAVLRGMTGSLNISVINHLAVYVRQQMAKEAQHAKPTEDNAMWERAGLTDLDRRNELDHLLATTHPTMMQERAEQVGNRAYNPLEQARLLMSIRNCLASEYETLIQSEQERSSFGTGSWSQFSQPHLQSLKDSFDFLTKGSQGQASALAMAQISDDLKRRIEVAAKATGSSPEETQRRHEMAQAAQREQLKHFETEIVSHLSNIAKVENEEAFDELDAVSQRDLLFRMIRILCNSYTSLCRYIDRTLRTERAGELPLLMEGIEQVISATMEFDRKHSSELAEGMDSNRRVSDIGEAVKNLPAPALKQLQAKFLPKRHHDQAA